MGKDQQGPIVQQLDTRPYPNFLFIGTSKAGSSWIYEILLEHQEVFVPRAKDIQFFDYEYHRGLDWYLSFFASAKQEKAVGELSHDYFLREESAARIRECLPGVRLLCSLREPASQILSSFLQHQTAFLNSGTSLREFAFQEDVLRACDYYYNLRPFYRLFSRENILVLFFDELERDPASFAQEIFRFLDVNPSFVPDVLEKRVLSAREPRLVWLAHLVYRIGQQFRHMGMPNLVGVVKRNRAFQRLLYKPVNEKPEMPEDLETAIRDYFRERYKELEDLIGQPLPEGWANN